MKRLLAFAFLLVGVKVFAQGFVVTDGNGGNNIVGHRVDAVSGETFTGDVVGKEGAYGSTPAATLTPTSTPTNTPTPTETPTPTDTPA